MKKSIIIAAIFFAAGILLSAAFSVGLRKAPEVTQSPVSSEKDTEIEELKRRVSLLESENKMLKEAPNGFYQKLKRGYDVNILINGDSIGRGNGASEGRDFASLLKAYLEEEYKVQCNITNISMGGNSSYAGYVREQLLSDGINYDLAIICYGENDGRKSLGKEYEAMIRTLHKKYNRCSIITVLESSQKTVTEKIQTIMDVSAHYSIPAADTIKAFNESGLSYDELTVDEKHPNDQGYRLYFEAIRDIINTKTGDYEPFNEDFPPPLFKEAESYDGFYYIPAEAFEREGEQRLKIKINGRIAGIPGIYQSLLPGGQVLSLYSDGALFGEYSFDWPYEDPQETIGGLSEKELISESELILNFSSPEAAGGFKGLTFTGTGE